MTNTVKKLDQAESHVVDILGSTSGRDQPIMLVDRALQLVNCIDDSLFSEKGTVFLDPFCKAGEILLTAAMKRCFVHNNKVASLSTHSEVAQAIYSENRFFALSPDERHHLLSLRTFCGNDRSHDKAFTKNIRNGAYLSDVDGTLDENKFKRELNSMLEYIKKTISPKKIIAIGNPPYQEADGGARASAKPIYNFFIETLMASDAIDEFAFVIPARWFAVGKGLDEFREKMIKCKQVKTIRYFERAEDVFPAVHVSGGVCFLHWQRKFQGPTCFADKDSEYSLDLSKFDIIPDDPKAPSILDKVFKKNPEKFISSIAWSRKPFGLPTNYFSLKGNEAIENKKGAIPCMVKGRKTKFLKRLDISVNADKIDHYKVAIPGAYATGARRCTLPKHQIFLLDKGSVATETYNVISSFQSKAQAERLITYLQTDFVRYLLGLRKLTQHIPKDRWAWVPLMDLETNWTDEKLFDYFNLTKAEREHIRSKVQEWS